MKDKTLVFFADLLFCTVASLMGAGCIPEAAGADNFTQGILKPGDGEEIVVKNHCTVGSVNPL